MLPFLLVGLWLAVLLAAAITGWLGLPLSGALLAATLAALLVRSVLKARAQRKRFEEWTAERRRQREREEREEAERRQRALESARSKLCTTEEELARALGSGLEEITIEGRLSKSYSGTLDAFRESAASYKVVLARHGKVVLKRG
jgi:hypothetical protein